MTELRVDKLSVTVGDATLVDEVSLSIKGGQFAVLLGPNGAGKTTLLRAMIGGVKMTSGSVHLDGKAVPGLDRMERARRLSYLPQQRSLAWPLPVRDVVALGRYCHGLRGSRPSPDDERAIQRALVATDLVELAERPTNTLSGGELARVHCARALCAEAPLLIADEPTAALDLRHAFAMMDVLRDFAAQGGAVLVVLHDLALAARYATHLFWMKNACLVAGGTLEETLTEARCAEVYGVRTTIRGRSLSVDGPV